MTDKMMRIAGRNGDGLAKAIRTNEDGTLEIQLNSSQAEFKIFNKSDPQTPRASSDYEFRTTGLKDFYFPQMVYPVSQEGHSQGDVVNILEQSIIITSTLDVPVTLYFGVTYATGGNFYRINRQTLWEMPAGNNTKKTALLVPEKGTYLTGTTSHAQTFELSELRQPYPAFFVGISPTDEVATTGEIEMMVCRRF